jgi:hexosaminidase
VGKESTIEFLENVLSEVCELFPSEYIHIGGDECPKDKWKECPHCQAKIKELCLVGNEKYSAEYYLQSYITRQMEEFLATKGKKIIGWDEILEGEISKNVTVMSWRGNEHGLEAIKRGHDVIMVNKGSLYFDYCQIKDSSKEPLTIGGHVSVEKVYSYEPYTDEMTDAEKARILGIQANMWTEYITSNDYLEYMILPRLSALSEIQWCSPTGKDYGRFLEKMGAMVRIYEALGYNYAKHIFIK